MKKLALFMWFLDFNRIAVVVAAATSYCFNEGTTDEPKVPPQKCMHNMKALAQSSTLLGSWSTLDVRLSLTLQSGRCGAGQQTLL